ncbi:uncharacterized protein BP01DRAFT_358510 [Aspergillus saccharolyticus JOP 1030-1]|uniref:Uncharacterized protein n=1 Tax=Aspergillus saccharolyticus JOP 1030-1 TaxID=1450539 RepID=A0A318Z8N7_9EURO|nr:hypothetical protein BP01DRAFT_358510 [Aspergillus saccharolyticus JOP 1030-1]PYH43539.1 hypothetical protein BP01DRAFT_358510 [Aspergillus saccharolyticus JOP 1030-1]
MFLGQRHKLACLSKQGITVATATCSRVWTSCLLQLHQRCSTPYYWRMHGNDLARPICIYPTFHHIFLQLDQTCRSSGPVSATIMTQNPKNRRSANVTDVLALSSTGSKTIRLKQCRNKAEQAPAEEFLPFAPLVKDLVIMDYLSRHGDLARPAIDQKTAFTYP